MTSSIVAELQRDALNSGSRTPDLLRKAKVVATKLDLPDFLKWIDAELNGYKNQVPDYRIVRGSPKAHNPLVGWIPLVMPTVELQNQISRSVVGQSIASLEPLSDDGDPVFFPYPPSLVDLINRGMEFRLPSMGLLVDRSQVAGILDAVRTAVLDWSLKLEKAGIMGDGYSFSEKEKEKAHEPSVNISVGSIGNFAGNMGAATTGATVNASQTVGMDLPRARQLVDQVEKVLPAADLDPRGEESARELVAGLRAELSQPAPDESIIRGMLGMLKRVMEGAASKIVADGISSNIDAVL